MVTTARYCAQLLHGSAASGPYVMSRLDSSVELHGHPDVLDAPQLHGSDSSLDTQRPGVRRHPTLGTALYS